MDPPPTHDPDRLHALRVAETLVELQQGFKDHEAASAKLRDSARSLPKPGPVAKLEIMRAAYDDLASRTPFLPFPDSVLPALLTLRKAQQTVEDSDTYLASHADSVDRVRQRLEVEQANLRDQLALSQRLQDRIHSLQGSLEKQVQMGPEDRAREHINELEGKRDNYRRGTRKLLKALMSFIADRLGPLLAAEELGGPVVGNMMDIDVDHLAAGFNAQGRKRKAKAKQDEDKRQRRIDEIWGTRQEEPQPGDDATESAAAGAELRDLVESLLNNVADTDEKASAYVQLPRETAAARFLVRSKVAQFHPKDSTQLRLVDFGRDLDD